MSISRPQDDNTQVGGGLTAVSVFVRIRALLRDELDRKDDPVFRVTGNDEIDYPKKCEGRARMTFDYVFTPEASQLDVYKQISPLTNELLKGYNGTVLAYGQTNSGKTYTMTGTEEKPGILRRMFEQFFDYQRLDAQDTEDGVDKEYLIHVCMLEVYNEKIRDLLIEDDDKYVEVREHPDHGFFVQGLTKKIVSNQEHGLNTLQNSLKNRTVAKSSRNEVSSRSHLIITISMEKSTSIISDGNLTDNVVLVSKMNLVDLAGSECLCHDNISQSLMQETKNINTSLTCLAVVINRLAETAETYIPYRDSKLTMLLRDSLGGNSKTLMLATLSPCQEHLSESIQTLRYARRAKMIKNKPKITQNPRDAMLKQLSQEVVQLKRQLSEQDAKLFSVFLGNKRTNGFGGNFTNQGVRRMSGSMNDSDYNLLQFQLDLRQKMMEGKSFTTENGSIKQKRRNKSLNACTVGSWRPETKQSLIATLTRRNLQTQHCVLDPVDESFEEIVETHLHAHSNEDTEDSTKDSTTSDTDAGSFGEKFVRLFDSGALTHKRAIAVINTLTGEIKKLKAKLESTKAEMEERWGFRLTSLMKSIEEMRQRHHEKEKKLQTQLRTLREADRIPTETQKEKILQNQPRILREDIDGSNFDDTGKHKEALKAKHLLVNKQQEQEQLRIEQITTQNLREEVENLTWQVSWLKSQREIKYTEERVKISVFVASCINVEEDKTIEVKAREQLNSEIILKEKLGDPALAFGNSMLSEIDKLKEEVLEARKQKVMLAKNSAEEIMRQNEIIRGLYSNISKLHKEIGRS